MKASWLLYWPSFWLCKFLPTSPRNFRFTDFPPPLVSAIFSQQTNRKSTGDDRFRLQSALPHFRIPPWREGLCWKNHRIKLLRSLPAIWSKRYSTKSVLTANSFLSSKSRPSSNPFFPYWCPCEAHDGTPLIKGYKVFLFSPLKLPLCQKKNGCFPTSTRHSPGPWVLPLFSPEKPYGIEFSQVLVVSFNQVVGSVFGAAVKDFLWSFEAPSPRRIR